MYLGVVRSDHVTVDNCLNCLEHIANKCVSSKTQIKLPGLRNEVRLIKYLFFTLIFHLCGTEIVIKLLYLSQNAINYF